MARRPIGTLVAPPRFLAFFVVTAIGLALAIQALGWRMGLMVGVDGGVATFLVASVGLLRARPDQMRAAAVRNDANRVLLLCITALVVLAVLGAVGAELAQKGAPHPPVLALVIATLALCWLFSNGVYALHYAHLYYADTNDKPGDDGGLAFPQTKEPDYWDFIYFAFCLGMCFQTSDVSLTDRRLRRVATGHCLIAFLFNLGVIAFTINVLGG